MTQEDPRTTGENVRLLDAPGDDCNDVVLVGVVHDHPASKHRVRTTVDDVEPDVLAVELPPLAVPLFERYATDERFPPVFGGEMSAAIRAAETDAVVGIDGPAPGFLLRLVRNLRREDSSASTVRRTLAGLASVTRHAVTCRLAASVAALTPVRPAVDGRVDHDCGPDDDPREQAADERDQIRRARAAMSVFGPSRATRLRDETREAHMASRLSTLRKDGRTVAVVGIDHLDAVADRLTGTASEGSGDR